MRCSFSARTYLVTYPRHLKQSVRLGRVPRGGLSVPLLGVPHVGGSLRRRLHRDLSQLHHRPRVSSGREAEGNKACSRTGRGLSGHAPTRGRSTAVACKARTAKSWLREHNICSWGHGEQAWGRYPKPLPSRRGGAPTELTKPSSVRPPQNAPKSKRSSEILRLVSPAGCCFLIPLPGFWVVHLRCRGDVLPIISSTATNTTSVEERSLFALSVAGTTRSRPPLPCTSLC